MDGNRTQKWISTVTLAAALALGAGTAYGQAKKKAPSKPPIGPPPAGDLDFEQRAEWLISLFPNHPIRGHQKTGLPDAVGRLAATDGADEQAKAYIIKYPVKTNEYFDYPWIARALHQWGDKFTPDQIAQLKQNLLKVTDWLDHGTENHAAMRVASAYLVAQYFPDETWKVGKQTMTSAQMMEAAKKKLIQRGQGFYRIGNNEQVSTSYALLNAYPILGLYDFAKDPEVRDIAEALLLYHLATVAANNFDGHILAPLNRKAPQQRYVPQELRAYRFIAIHQLMAWMLWGQNQVFPEDFLVAGEPPYQLFFATSTFRTHEAINAVAHGAGTPYELRSVLSGFNQWGATNQRETWRYIYRHADYALGAPFEHRMQIGGFFLDYDFFNVVWKSDDRHRQLQIAHPYWRSNHGENAWKETHSPFMQTAAHKNAAIVLFNIPQADPWGTKGRERYWVEQRNKYVDNLMKLGQARFPASVDEFAEKDGVIFFREGNVYVALRPLKPGYEIDREGVEEFIVVKSREAQTGFAMEVGTTEQNGTFEAFQTAFLANTPQVDWRSLIASMRTIGGDELAIKYDTNLDADENRFVRFAPTITVNGKPVTPEDWPPMDSPVVRLQDSVLTVDAAGKKLSVDWSGELPKITR